MFGVLFFLAISCLVQDHDRNNTHSHASGQVEAEDLARNAHVTSGRASIHSHFSATVEIIDGDVEAYASEEGVQPWNSLALLKLHPPGEL